MGLETNTYATLNFDCGHWGKMTFTSAAEEKEDFVSDDMVEEHAADSTGEWGKIRIAQGR